MHKDIHSSSNREISQTKRIHWQEEVYDGWSLSIMWHFLQQFSFLSRLSHIFHLLSMPSFLVERLKPISPCFIPTLYHYICTYVHCSCIHESINNLSHLHSFRLISFVSFYTSYPWHCRWDDKVGCYDFFILMLTHEITMFFCTHSQ